MKELGDIELESVAAGKGGRAATKAAPESRQRGVPHNPSHTCPRCGRPQFAIHSSRPDGKHVHCCSCGQCWHH